MNSKQLMYTGILAAVTVCGGLSPQAQALEGGALADYFFADSARTNTNNGLGFALDLIHFYQPHQGISLRGSWANLETDLPQETDFHRYSATLGYWRYLDGDGLTLPGFRPYVNAGIGVGIQETIITQADSDSGVLVEAAVGLVSKGDVLIENLKFRPELRLDYEDVYSGALDLTVGLGLHYSFGAMKQRVAAIPAQTPAAPAAPAPALAPAPAPAPADSDRDGVADGADACPGTAPMAVDERGCARIEQVVLRGVNFATNSALVNSAEALDQIRAVAATMKEYSKLKVEVGGHADSSGDDKKNQVLSERRAQSVKALLVKAGVAASRLTAKGYGETRSVDSNDTAAGRANNRRVEFKILN